MHDVIIDDTRTSLAATTANDLKAKENKTKKKKRSFSIYLLDWVE